MASLAEDQAKPIEEEDEEEEETYSYAMQLSMSMVLPVVMIAAMDLDVFEIIAKAGPGAKLSVPEIVVQITNKNPDAHMMLDRILRLLVSHRVLDCSVFGGQRLYSLAPVSKYFIRNQDGVSLRPFMALNQDKLYLDSWIQLKGVIVGGGIPFNKAHGMHVFEYCDADPRFNEVFNSAMFNHTSLVMKKILESYRGFDRVQQLVDVGGGVGVNLNMVTSKYAHIKGVNFDLPHVIQYAPSYPGVEHIGGDMFERIPNGDAILMKWIIHNWDDEHCLRLLKNCYEAIPEKGKVIVIDAVLPEVPDTSNAARETFLMDSLMFLLHQGGKERTKQEFMALATGAGFKGINYESYVCNLCVMEFFK